MTIVQTFITAPMSVYRLKQNVIIAALSLAYAHKSGYKVKMYTDTVGYSLLSKLPYDDINTELDGIELPKSNALWSIGKYYALLKEPLGTIHTDFDVLLKKPCLNGLLAGVDAVCQIKERIEGIQSIYEHCRQFLISESCGDLVNVSKPIKYTYNVGVIGYSTEAMRQAHAGTIKKVYERFKNYKGSMPTIDFYIEQAHLYHLSKKGFKVKPVVSDATLFVTDYRMITEFADAVGYCHLQSEIKYNPIVMKKVISLLETEFKDIYNLVADIVNITKI